MKKLSIIFAAILCIGVVGAFATYHLTDMKGVSISISRTFPLDEITDLNIQSTNHNISILPTDADEITVELTGISPRNYEQELITEVNGSTLEVTLEEQQIGVINIGFHDFINLQLTIYLPEATYETIIASTRNGSLTVKEIEMNILNVESNNGKIALNDLTGGILTAATRNGRINSENIQAQGLITSSHNGAIKLKNISADLKADTRNGQISLQNPTIDQNITMKTRNGRIAINTNHQPTNATIMANTANGRISIFGSNSDQTFGNGDHTISLSAQNGSINVD